MEILAPAWWCLRLVLLVAGLLVPGAAILRALRLPLSLGGSFAGSAVVIYGGALALNALGFNLSFASLATVLAMATVAAWFAGRQGTPSPVDDDPFDPPLFAPFTRLGGFAPVMLLYWAVIGFLLAREPLAGPDVGFRWAFLPEQWLRQGTLDFYPPVSAHDFLSYFWVESIPPGVASLHAWAFACGGSFAAVWIAPVIGLQFLALHDLAWRAGSAIGGDPAARPAAVLVAACPVLNWACRLGQESGLTALAALGLAVALLRWRATARPGWAAAAGIFAVLGAMTREYGLVFPALAVAALAASRASGAAWRAFAWAALPLGLAWPLRCALRTGNPFYSLNVAGLLPVNAVFFAWINDHRALFNALGTFDGWLYSLRWFALGAAPALLGWFALPVLARRHRAAVFGAIAVAAFLALWILSVPYTVGGLFYSLRVATPALALGAVIAGAVFVCRPAVAKYPWLPGALLFITLPFTLLLPENPLHTPLRDWPAPWRPALPTGPSDLARTVAQVVALHGSVVLTDSPGFQGLLAPHGVSAIPFWSPQAAWLFDPQTTPADAARRWRESGLHLVVLSKFAPAIAFVNHRARWSQPPFQIRLAADNAGFAIFSVEAPP